MQVLLVRLNKGMNSKQDDYFNFRQNTIEVTSIACAKYKHAIEEIHASKEPQLVLVATLEAVDEWHEFVDAGEFEYLLDNPVLTESTEGEEVEGEGIEKQK